MMAILFNCFSFPSHSSLVQLSTRECESLLFDRLCQVNHADTKEKTTKVEIYSLASLAISMRYWADLWYQSPFLLRGLRHI